MDHYVACFLCLGLGYVLGRLDGIVRQVRHPLAHSEAQATHSQQRPDVHLAGTPVPRMRKVVIDDSKFVTDLSTEGMTSAGKESLGTITQTEDTIGSAASKLAALKGRKG